MVDFRFPAEVKDLAEAVLAFVEKEVVPRENANRELLDNPRRRYTEDGRYAPEVLALRREVRMKSAEAGFYTMFGSEKLGGGGLGALATVHVREQLGKEFGPGRVLLQDVVIPSSFTNGLTRVLEHVDPNVITPLLSGIASGDKTLCFALSEPDAGSDVYGIKTTARKDGDDWILNGSKQWITNSPYADYAVVFAVTEPATAESRRPGISAFFVDTTWEGFTVTSTIPIMGHLGSDMGIIALDNLRVPGTHLMGQVNRGFDIALGGVSTGRLTISSAAIGYSEWAFNQAMEYAQQRSTFGKPIIEHQAIELHLAECAMDIYAAKAMLIHTAWSVDNGQRPIKELSMLKAYATEMFYRVTGRVLQVYGGMGLTNELRLEEAFRLARTQLVPDGTAEIQRKNVIAQMKRGDTEILAAR